MVNKELVLRKLKKLRVYLDELEFFQEVSYDEYLDNFQHRRTVERLIQLIVDIAVDINSHTLVDAGCPPPEDAYTSFINAGKLGALPTKFARELAPSTGERNILVHEYEKIDDAIVYSSIKDTISMYNQYLAYYLKFISSL